MKSSIYRYLLAATILAAAVSLSSCLGIETEIDISQSGSGDVKTTYALSEELVAFGEVEANKNTLPVPLSREDLAASLGGRPGLELKKWSKSRSGTDTLINSEISFASLDDLVTYLDPQKRLATYSTQSDIRQFSFSLGETLPALDPQMRLIAQESFAPYTFKFIVKLPKAPQSALSSDPAITAKIEGNKAIFEGKMKDIVVLSRAPELTLVW